MSLAGVRPLFRRRVRAALGAAGAVQGAAGVRLAACDAAAATAAVHRAAFGHRWRRKDADEIRHMRQRLEETAAAGDLKRGPGGIVDIEFLVQMLQLQHARKYPPPPHAQHAGRPGRVARGRAAFGDEDYRFFDGQLPLFADDRGPAAADELDRPRHVAPRRDRVEQAGALDARPERGAFAGVRGGDAGGAAALRGAVRRGGGERAGVKRIVGLVRRSEPHPRFIQPNSARESPSSSPL